MKISKFRTPLLTLDLWSLALQSEYDQYRVFAATQTTVIIIIIILIIQQQCWLCITGHYAVMTVVCPSVCLSRAGPYKSRTDSRSKLKIGRRKAHYTRDL